MNTSSRLGLSYILSRNSTKGQEKGNHYSPIKGPNEISHYYNSDNIGIKCRNYNEALSLSPLTMSIIEQKFYFHNGISIFSVFTSKKKPGGGYPG